MQSSYLLQLSDTLWSASAEWHSGIPESVGVWHYIMSYHHLYDGMRFALPGNYGVMYGLLQQTCTSCKMDRGWPILAVWHFMPCSDCMAFHALLWLYDILWPVLTVWHLITCSNCVTHHGLLWLCDTPWPALTVWHLMACCDCVTHHGLLWLCDISRTTTVMPYFTCHLKSYLLSIPSPICS